MKENITKIVKPSGLDTLSERSLRRLTDRWTGSLHDMDTLLDESSAEQVTSRSTFEHIVGHWREAREVYHTADLSEVLGSESHLAEGVERVAVECADSVQSVAVAEILPQEVMLSGGEAAFSVGEWMPVLYDALVVGVMLCYVYCIYRYFDDIVALFQSVFQNKVVGNERSVERRRSDIFYGALGKLFMLGLFFVGIISALVLRRVDSTLSAEQLFYVPMLTAMSFVVVVLVQNMVLAVIGFITRSMAEVAALVRIRLIYFVLASLMVAPVLLVSQLGEAQSYQIWQNIGIIAAIIAFVLFVRESIGFFISKKVSILHWILYLCAVEILPFTLLWQGVVRLA